MRALIDEKNLEAGMKLPLNVNWQCNSAYRVIHCARRCKTGERRRAAQSTRRRDVYSWRHDTWSEQNIVQPLKTLMAMIRITVSIFWKLATPLKPARMACGNARHTWRQRKDSALLEATLSEDPDIASQADVRFHLRLPKPHITSCCCKPCAVSSSPAILSEA